MVKRTFKTASGQIVEMTEIFLRNPKTGVISTWLCPDDPKAIKECVRQFAEINEIPAEQLGNILQSLRGDE